MLSSALSQKSLSNWGFFFFFHIWIKLPSYHYDYGVGSWPTLYIAARFTISALRCIGGLGSISKPLHIWFPPPKVSEKSPEHIEITYYVARIRLDLLVFCLAALLWSDGKKCFFSQCLRKKKSFIFERVIALCRRNKEPLGLFYTYFQQFLASILCPSLCLWASWERNALQR